ncbi:MAG: AEC family transporter [Clostridia bacterium]|nr:AEC family transporter [Clostridia bacterium]
MANFILTCNMVIPVFLVMVVGYVCRQLKMVSAENVSAMNKLVFKIFLPVSLAKSLMTLDPNADISYSVMLYCALGVIATFILAILIVPRCVKGNPQRGAMIQALFRSNYAILGIPLIESLFPAGDGGVSAMMVMITVPLFNVLAVVTLETYRGGKFNLLKILKGILKNPLIWGCVIGFIIFKCEIKLPELVSSTVSKLASVASPLALFSLGATIDLKKFSGNMKLLIPTVAGRLVIVPGVLLFIAYLIGYRGPEFAALMIAFGSPCAVSSYTMAAQMDSDGELAAQLVMMTTVLSILSIFLMVLLFKGVGVF